MISKVSTPNIVHLLKGNKFAKEERRYISRHFLHCGCYLFSFIPNCLFRMAEFSIVFVIYSLFSFTKFFRLILVRPICIQSNFLWTCTFSKHCQHISSLLHSQPTYLQPIHPLININIFTYKNWLVNLHIIYVRNIWDIKAEVEILSCIY